MEKRPQEFIPCTMARPIGGGVVFRPIKSWHSATYAGERLEKLPGGSDRSGCLVNQTLCYAPLTVTHRLYWREDDPEETVSAFLSYPGGMGYCGDEYFWETYGIGDDIDRWSGDDAEAEMETNIRLHFAGKT